MGINKEEIQTELLDQKVTSVYRMKKFNDAKVLVDTPTLILTFDSKIVPKVVKAGFLSLVVKTYYP